MTNKEAKLEELSRTLATIAWDHSVVTPDDYIDLAQRMLSALVQFGESGQEEERYTIDQILDILRSWHRIDGARIEQIGQVLQIERQPAAHAPEKGEEE